MICANCGNTVADGSKFCPNCGQKIDTKRFCSNCGAEMPPNARFCSECGTAVSGTSYLPTKFEPYCWEISNQDLCSDQVTVTFMDHANVSDTNIAVLEFNDKGNLVITSKNPGRFGISMEVTDSHNNKAQFVGTFQVAAEGNIECLEYHYEDFVPAFENYEFEISCSDLSTNEVTIVDIDNAHTSNVDVAGVKFNDRGALVIVGFAPGRTTITADIRTDDDVTATFVGTFEVHQDGQIECIEYHPENIENGGFWGGVGAFAEGFLTGLFGR